MKHTSQKNVLFTLLFFTLLCLAAYLRIQNIDTRPMHGDEAMQGYQASKLWQESSYKYNPTDFHGPTLYYVAQPFLALSSAHDYSGIEKHHLRSVTVVFSLLTCMLLYLLQRDMGQRSVLWALLLMAISPAFVFYARYFIQEPLFVCFGLGLMISLWHFFKQPSTLWAALGGLSLGLMIATKETFLVNVIAILITLALLRFWKTSSSHNIADEGSTPTTQTKKQWIVFTALTFLIPFTFYSDFFKEPIGFVDMIAGYSAHSKRAGGGEFEEDITQGAGHTKPFYYFAQILSYHGEFSVKSFLPRILKNQQTRAFTEFVILALALVALWRGAKGGIPHVNLTFLRATSIYSVAMFMGYSLIPYKTPWCLLNFHLGFILLAGMGAHFLTNHPSSKKAKAVFTLIILTLSVDLVRQVHLQSSPEGISASEEFNPYAYSHTTEQFENEAIGRLKALAKIHPKGLDMPVVILNRNYQPFTWYCRSFKKVGYYENNFPDYQHIAKLPIIITSPEDTKTEEILSKTHTQDYWSITSNEFLFAYIRNDYWEIIINQ